MQIIQRILQEAAMLLKDSVFISRHKLSPTAFLRHRKLPFDRIAGTLIHLAKNSLQIVCNKLGDFFHMDQPASKQAFSQARLNLSYTCFQELNDRALQAFYKEDRQGLWKGYRLFAADGSTIRLPESKDTLLHFGRWSQGDKKASEHCPIVGRISEFTDMAGGLIVSAALAPWGVGEKTLAEGQLRLIAEKMRTWGVEKFLFIYDRGYPSKDFFSLHHTLGADFVFRIPRRFNKEIDALMKSDRADQILRLYEERPLLRIAVYQLPSGEKEVLLTSLTDQEHISYEDLFEIYGMRWRASEEGYKRQKVQLELQNFATKSAMGVLQEFWAAIYINNIIAISCYEIEGPQLPGNNSKYRLNRSVLFGSLREDVLKTLTSEISAESFLEKFRKLATRTKVPIRPGRQFSRANLGKPKRFFALPRVC
jgi:Transposase DDE domain